MTNEIELVLNATSYGIEESKAKQLEKVFVPMVEKFKELEEQYNDVMSSANNQITKDVCSNAKIVTRKYVKVRTETDGRHKIAKQSNLIEGRAIDGLRNLVKFACNDHEESLKKVSNYYEIIEEQERQELKEKRITILEKYNTNPGTGDLADMSDDVWKHYIKSVETDFKAKKEAEIKAEKERIESERISKLHTERRDLLIPYWPYIENDDDQYGEMNLKEFNSLLTNLKKAKSDYEAEQERISLENEKLKKEAELKRIADEKAEKERLAKQEEERKAKDAETLRLKNEADEKRKLELASDKEKLEKWVSEMAIDGIGYGELSKGSVEIAKDINSKFHAFKNWAVSEIKKIK